MTTETSDLTLPALVINLPEQAERLSFLQNKLAEGNIPLQLLRIDGVRVELQNEPYQYVCNMFSSWMPERSITSGFWRKYATGSLGCKKAHINAVAHARLQGWTQALILEDDVAPLATAADWESLLQDLSAVSKQHDWGICYLSTLHKRAPEPFTEKWNRVTAGLSCAAYIVHCRAYDYIIENALTSGYEIDAFHAFYTQQQFLCLSYHKQCFAQTGAMSNTNIDIVHTHYDSAATVIREPPLFEYGAHMREI